MKSRLTALMLSSALVLSGAGMAGAQEKLDKNVKIGVLTDMSGLYSDISGAGAVLATQMAVEDSGLREKGWKIDVISADHQLKPDVTAAIARQWADVENVDAYVDVVASSTALALNPIAVEKNRVHLNSGAATSALTGKSCTPNTVHWAYDTYEVANGTGKAVTKAGGDTWFFITADYAFGVALEGDTRAVVEKNGGKVLGGVKHPLNSSDFSSFLLQAQSSKAKIIGLANAGGDTTNAVKQAAEFGIVQGGQKLASLLLFITDVHSLGLKVANGLQLTESFYWDTNDGTRNFSKRFAARMKNGAMPSMVQAGDYASTLHYLKALEALGGNPHDGMKAVAKMKELPTDDPLFGKGVVRADGRKIHPAYLFEVKKPEESKGPWDYYKLVTTIPAEEAFRPLSESDCPLVKK
ncbi:MULTISPECIES: ABC transporter substrate-binding protein [unclassified Afipia]|uniref:ABC transporter substrate-binding protein n=1 Tax=unclassified Afipia TaxID=2642050 RepID=UPI000465A441|nr:MULTISPECIES: ABC transporter substrate-binding protein [unclassified Afipia]MAH72315.1 ABC transporter permease [Afipia sp.]OUX58607.1 MAG: ABC transporter permease [Afipia sp. TMED4]HAO41590.1 ABC transporter permease [Afipia sp.]HAP14222.1 ABC transporter permease [Afipia sp.]HCX16048.1 ABC transporter permease [Afipia sp.]